MSNEVRENPEVAREVVEEAEEMVAVRFSVPKSIHDHIMLHRWNMCIEEKREVAFYKACINLFEIALGRISNR